MSLICPEHTWQLVTRQSASLTIPGFRRQIQSLLELPLHQRVYVDTDNRDAESSISSLRIRLLMSEESDHEN